MSEMLEPRDTCQGELQTRYGNNQETEGVAVKKVEWSQIYEEHFGIRHADREFGVCPADFFGPISPVFPHYVPIPPFWNGKVYLFHCMLEVCDLPFDF